MAMGTAGDSARAHTVWCTLQKDPFTWPSEIDPCHFIPRWTFYTSRSFMA